MPKIDPYWLLSNFAKVTPTTVGKIGAKASPVRTMARMARAADWVQIITRMDASDTVAAPAMTRTPMAVRFFTAELRKRPAAMARPNRLRTMPAQKLASAGAEVLPRSSSISFRIQDPIETSREM